jgi:hypothetical protein
MSLEDIRQSPRDKNGCIDFDRFVVEEFYWRKHAKLQEFMELLWERRGNSRDSFNCEYMELTKDEVLALLAMVSNDELPESLGGFFYGHQFQDESSRRYREEDIAFCHKAYAAIVDGQSVIYTCWY